MFLDDGCQRRQHMSYRVCSAVASKIHSEDAARCNDAMAILWLGSQHQFSVAVRHFEVCENFRLLEAFWLVLVTQHGEPVLDSEGGHRLQVGCETVVCTGLRYDKRRACQFGCRAQIWHIKLDKILRKDREIFSLACGMFSKANFDRPNICFEPFLEGW